MSQYEDRVVTIARGSAINQAKCNNQSLPWSQFRQLFHTPLRTTETQAYYQQLDKKNPERARLKVLNGWYLGAPIEGKTRNRTAVQARQIITLDLDTLTPETFQQLTVHGNHYLSQYEMLLHTTRSHTPENPRLRAIILCENDIELEEFEPLTRILAWHCDSTMEAVDKATFRIAQMMYFPTCSIDQEYWHGYNSGKTLIAAELLNSWQGDWRDFSCLPRKTSDNPRRFAEKAEDPATKPGLIGAFCRVYGIRDVIEQFLPEIYGNPDTHSADVRYTYLKGQSQFGAVVYDDKFMYSWHGTDPAGDQLRNAWDLVRIHHYGHLDIGKSEDNPNALPSQIEMTKWVKKIADVNKQLVKDSLDVEAMFGGIEDDLEDDSTADRIAAFLGSDSYLDDVPDYPGHNVKIPIRQDWYTDLELGREGIKATLNNVLLILTHDKRLRNCCQLNAFNGEIMYKKKIISQIPEVNPPEVKDKINGDLWNDTHDAFVKAILSAPRGKNGVGYGIQVSDNILTAAVRLVADGLQFHPVIHHLVSLPEWDGIERVERLWIDYLGTPDNAFYRESAKLFLTGAIARLFYPGIPFDFMPILMGEQGLYKTTFVRELGFGSNKWGKEFDAPLDQKKDATEQIKSAWILEMSEISALKYSEIQHQKSFLTRITDRVRLSYDRRMSEFDRQCVFVGTSNEYEFLKDYANRRYWPIRVANKQIDMELFKINRDQIWSEALYLFIDKAKRKGYDRDNIFFNLSIEANKIAENIQQDARVQSADEFDIQYIQNYLDTPVKLSELNNTLGLENDSDKPDPLVLRVKTNAKQILGDCLNESIETLNPSTKNYRLQSIGNTMKEVSGWARGQDWGAGNGRDGSKISVDNYGRGRGYVRADATAEEFDLGYRIHEEFV